MSEDLTTTEPTPEVPAARLPAVNAATSDLTQYNSDMLERLRTEQHYADQMVLYWQGRHADISRAIEGVMGAEAAMNKVAPRATRVVTPRRKPKDTTK